jgi:hypothetical protein
MAGILIGAEVAALAAIVAAGGHALAAQPYKGPMTPFGGPVAVHIAHVGHIDVDLGPGGRAGLERVRCGGIAGGTTACYVAR